MAITAVTYIITISAINEKNCHFEILSICDQEIENETKIWRGGDITVFLWKDFIYIICRKSVLYWNTLFIQDIDRNAFLLLGLYYSLIIPNCLGILCLHS